MALGDQTREYLGRKKAGLHALLLNWAGTMEGYAKSHAPWTDRTSHARQSLHGGVDVRDGQHVLYLSHGMEYGIWLEKGTPPHEIKPKDKKALFWHGAEHPVKKVMHPGTKSYAIVVPTVDVHLPRIRQTVTDYWRD